MYRDDGSIPRFERSLTEAHLRFFGATQRYQMAWLTYLVRWGEPWIAAHRWFVRPPVAKPTVAQRMARHSLYLVDGGRLD
jgi:hypothetical protein